MESIIFRFFRQSFLSFKSLYGFLNLKSIIFYRIINPALQFIFFTLLTKHIYHSNNDTSIIIGNSIILCANSAFFGVGLTMVYERQYGTLKSIIASTSNKFLIFTGRGTFYLLDSALNVTIGLICGYIFFGLSLDPNNTLLLALCILLGMLSSMGCGLFIGAYGLLLSDINFLMNLSFYILLIFSGAIIPISNFPEYVQFISYCLPLSHSIEAAKEIAMNQINISTLYKIVIEFLKGIIWFTGGYFVLLYLEKRSKIQGTLDL